MKRIRKKEEKNKLEKGEKNKNKRKTAKGENKKEEKKKVAGLDSLPLSQLQRFERRQKERRKEKETEKGRRELIYLCRHLIQILRSQMVERVFQ